MKSTLAIWATLLFALSACSSDDHRQRLASAGVLDLGDWDPAAGETVELAGQWEFYWMQLLAPPEIAAQTTAPMLQTVPAVWTDYGAEFSVTGYATYRLRLLLPEEPGLLGLLLDGQGSSFRLWLNGELLAVDGDVATEPGATIRSGQPQLVFFQPGQGEAELVLQISNFSHRSAGFRNALLLGSADTILARYQSASTFEWVYLSLLLALALYHYYLFSQRPVERFSFHFANLCLLAAIRIGFTGNNVLVAVLSFLDWEAALRIEYLTFFLVAPVFTAMMRSLYPQDVALWFLRATWAVATAYSLYIFFVDTLAVTQVVPGYQMILLLEMVYFVYFLARLFRYRRPGRYYMGAATVVGLLGLFSEILFSRGILPYAATAPLGMVGFVFVQAIFMAARYAASFRHVEELSGKLEQNLQELEESENKYRSIFEESRDVIFLADLSGKILDISPACADLFGLSPEEVIGNGTNIYAITNKEDRSRFARLMDDSGAVQNFEFELDNPRGRRIRASLSASTRLDSDGNIKGIQGTVRDISDKVQAREQRRRADKLELIAATDALTGACTRRYFDDVAKREMARSMRGQSALSLVIFDIDYFKQINDRHGHLAGDKVLVTLSGLCQENIRSTDVFCRFGGEEFIILMPETELQSAWQKVEALRQQVTKKPLVQFNGIDIPVSFSAGVAAWDGEETMEALIGRADQALYRAKQQGRNRVLLAGQSET
jgi:diguanylate cyclase (GGDEF)-like protein/PAS domain S-box-containing protein